MPGTWTNQGNSITEVTNYGDFVAGSDGDLGHVTSNDTYWVYNGATQLWLPTDVQPTAPQIISDLPMGQLPSDASPAWTKEGTQTAAIAAGILTLTDASITDYVIYKLTDATNIVTTKNIGFIARLKVTAQGGSSAPGWKVVMSITPDNTPNFGGIIGMACGTNLSDTNNFSFVTTYTGVALPAAYTALDNSPDNNTFQTYYLLYFKDTNTFKAGVLNGNGDLFVLHQGAFGNPAYLTANTVLFGSWNLADTSTTEWDWVKVFNF
jgi:hypothetical protein